MNDKQPPAPDGQVIAETTAREAMDQIASLAAQLGKGYSANDIDIIAIAKPGEDESLNVEEDVNNVVPLNIPAKNKPSN